MKNGSGLPQNLIYGEGSANQQAEGGNDPLPVEEVRLQAKIWLDNYDPQGHLSDRRHKGAHTIPIESIDKLRPRCHKH